MEEKVEKSSKYSVSNIVTLVIFAIMAIFAIILIEEMIRGFITKNENIFTQNYIKNLIYLTISAFIYFILFVLESKNRIFYGEWLKIALVLYIFISLNVCNFFNLYTYRVVKYIIFAINGVFFTVFGVSIYYNYLKNENNKVKAKALMVVIFSTAIAIALSFCTELLWYLIDLISSNQQIFFKEVIFDMLFALLGSVIINVFFYLSLIKSKKFINYCLIDIQK